PLARRFGPALLLRLDQAFGRAPEPITPILPPEAVQHRMHFVEPLLTANVFATVIDTLADAVCATLAERELGARQLDLTFERVDGRVQVLHAGLACPARAPRHLARLLVERLEMVDPGLGVEAMLLVASRTERLAPAQAGMFAESVLVGGGTAGDVNYALGQEFRAPADIAALVDRLQIRFGAGRVYRMEPVESDVPERAARRVPALAPLGPLLAWPALPRPPRLLLYPQPIQALSVLPDHPPAIFIWRRVRHRVRRADGPERISGEWWRSEREVAAVRDYWAVEDEGGRRFWLYRSGDGIDPATGDLSWFLHGLF
ncbi:MAG TPA: DNA polymerase Y family protein, partial [Acetobacteraceae bacterium]|nr:DNA polymerase Y family protein [Acetobacteraceae bacterium]